MGFIKWNDSLELGYKQIDDQHKMLVDIINELYEAAKKGKSWEKIDDIMTGLINYTRHHFKDEEKLMKSINYTGFTVHRKEHNQLTLEVAGYMDKMKKKELILTVEMISFLKGWLVDHIMNSDMKIKEFL